MSLQSMGSGRIENNFSDMSISGGGGGGFMQGRMDMDFLNWRWKPDQCDLPRFNAKTFLQIVQGKTMAFIGDSVARNHMESLLCLLSQVSLQI